MTTGKTTNLMEKVVNILAEIPRGGKVYVTGAHTKWLLELEKEFKAAGLVDVIFIPVGSVVSGKLRGCRGILLIDDTQDMSLNELDACLEEKRQMASKL